MAQVENVLNMMNTANLGNGVSGDHTPVLNGAAVAHVVSAQNCIAMHSTALCQKLTFRALRSVSTLGEVRIPSDETICIRPDYKKYNSRHEIGGPKVT